MPCHTGQCRRWPKYQFHPRGERPKSPDSLLSITVGQSHLRVFRKLEKLTSNDYFWQRVYGAIWVQPLKVEMKMVRCGEMVMGHVLVGLTLFFLISSCRSLKSWLRAYNWVLHWLISLVSCSQSFREFSCVAWTLMIRFCFCSQSYKLSVIQGEGFCDFLGKIFHCLILLFQAIKQIIPVPLYMSSELMNFLSRSRKVAWQAMLWHWGRWWSFSEGAELHMIRLNFNRRRRWRRGSGHVGSVYVIMWAV